jgi:hypothetical protein
VNPKNVSIYNKTNSNKMFVPLIIFLDKQGYQQYLFPTGFLPARDTGVKEYIPYPVPVCFMNY